MLISLSLIIATFISTIIANTPIIIGLNILICALSITYIIFIYLSPWYAFLLFLIYVGGILILFAYILSLTPNIFIILGTHTITLILITISTFIIVKNIDLIINLNGSLKFQSSILYSNITIYVFIIIVILLLIILIIVSKIIIISKGPLRPFIS